MRKTLLASAVASWFSVGAFAQTPVDMGVVNEDKLIDMLVRNGTVSADATAAENVTHLTSIWRAKFALALRVTLSLAKRHLSNARKC